MRTVTLEDAQRDLPRLLRETGRGETLLISDGGRPLAVMLSTQGTPAAVSRRLGFMEGQFTVPDDFDTMFQDEIIAMFEGEE